MNETPGHEDLSTTTPTWEEADTIKEDRGRHQVDTLYPLTRPNMLNNTSQDGRIQALAVLHLLGWSREDHRPKLPARDMALRAVIKAAAAVRDLR